jgi:hypothetical protein
MSSGLEEKADRVVKWNSSFLPRLNVRNLLCVMSEYRDCERGEGILARVLGNLVDSGLVSYSRRGNYHVEALMQPGEVFNPALNGRVLYFTVKSDCETFLANYFKREDHIGLRFLDNGKYSVPKNPKPRDWRVIRLKRKENLEHTTRVGGWPEDKVIITQLRKKRIVNPGLEDSFRVALQNESKHGRVYVNFGYLFFTRFRHARSFALSLPETKYQRVLVVSPDGKERVVRIDREKDEE